MDALKKIFKVLGIIAAVAGVAAGVYVLVKKLCEKKNAGCCEGEQDNYVSCSCLDADFVAEQGK